MYPRLLIDIEKLKHNATQLLKLCKENNIFSCMAVVKAFSGHIEVVKELIPLGFSHLGDSRIENLKKYKDLPIKKVLLRLPMNKSMKDVILYSDISLNSEIKTIKLLDQTAKKLNKIHQIILMFDLGDLREGIFYLDDFLPIVKDILLLKNIQLTGIGANLTCYGGVIPDKTNLGELIHIKNTIESNFNIKLEMISGGNSSMIPFFGKGIIPKEINNLRVGEAFLFGRETAYGTKIPNMFSDCFTLEAKIIECKTKPSYPIGEIGLNSFGLIPDITDKGMMKRAILAIGKQDVILSNLYPKDKSVEVLGGSSDHLICDVTNTAYVTGDILTFDVNYPGLVHLMNSSYVKKTIKKKLSKI